jgi:small redox-active disulfide protein 2
MRIKVYGTGCKKCQTLYELVVQVIEDTGVTAEIEKVQDMQKIIEAELLLLPGLMIDGVLKSAGRLPTKEEVRGWIS